MSDSKATAFEDIAFGLEKAYFSQRQVEFEHSEVQSYIQRFSWEEMARNTLAIYQSAS